MIQIIFWTIVFSVAGAGTTILLGDRGLLTGNMLTWGKFFQLLFHWRFILAMLLAFLARYSFMVINSNLLKIPSLAQNSTNITAFITSVGIVFLVAGNYLFLGERVNFQQGIGAALIMLGIWVVLK